ncbi:MAG: ribosome biogenesis GTPase Der [Acidobacteria bacterium]|nr:ribosome biogenesis GTPase Der [Acidobacteriota bacterium]
MSRVPVVAIIGRPNVGKSTLVNRIVGRKEAVVDAQSGVTRDRREFDAEWSGVEFCLIDTGGWEARPDKGIPAGIKVQSEVALSLADMAIFVADATTDISDDDLGIARLLQKSGKPYILVANKVDSPKQEHTYDHLWGLGLGQPFPLSALHGRGTGDFLDAVLAEMPAVDGDDPERVPLASLAIMGRPNVGKSTLLNKLAGEDRAIVSEIPGTTRDPVNIVVDLDGEPFEVIDTAGIKRRTKITDDVEFYSTLRAREVLWQSDVALLLIDGTRGASHQEQRLAEEIVKSGTGLIVLLNKWDVIDEKQRDFTEDSVADRLAFVSWAPVLRLSAKTGSRIHRLPKAIRMVLESARFRVSTGEINRKIREWQDMHSPPVRKGKRPRIIYSVQADVSPPTFLLYVRGGTIGDDYLRYIEGKLRATYGFAGTPIRVVAKRRER